MMSYARSLSKPSAALICCLFHLSLTSYSQAFVSLQSQSITRSVSSLGATSGRCDQQQHGTNSRATPFQQIRKQNRNEFVTTISAAALATSLFLSSSQPAMAAGYESLSSEQKFVAEAWRTVDATFLDRTFNGQDWFQVRQDLVKKKYKSMEEAQEAVSNMMSNLGDKYTRYLSPAKYQSLVDSATGTLAGIGVEIATNKEQVPIVSDVEPNSPAQKAGLLPDDIFLESDGVKFDKTTTPDDVALKLRGLQGSRVSVTVRRGETTKDFIIQREPIKVTSVRSYTKGKIGVIRIKNFSGTTGATVKEKVEDFQKKGVKTILFDLRSNPGGLLPGGTETASLFLKRNKPLVFVVSNKGVVDAQETFADGFDTETPIVLLVDHNTASAAEVFTAALKENGRAKVVGEQTFGKGIIQTIRELSNQNGGVAVTVARYETPRHNDINKSGISVDEAVNVECPKDDALACVPSSVL
ncbi:ClpP/crotonase-like domain containing protein [Nitzschia inconspicua]|uniref:C-terminal processing peptidase n=1 Tax=Nitzschia inconspicua TaxID=303405 RepID=A0A9K3Q4X3_9STRA|nr:ClpP/crotonase-like domain containing protein [Nitzschia inconspicua]